VVVEEEEEEDKEEEEEEEEDNGMEFREKLFFSMESYTQIQPDPLCSSQFYHVVPKIQ
jgi:hypothetical protein